LSKRDTVVGPIELKGLPTLELEKLFESSGIKRYRARQVYDAMYISRIDNVQEMKLLPHALRETLDSAYRTESVHLKTLQVSDDGTKKFLFELLDGSAIESVLIPSEMAEEDGHPRRRTLCISTQVGCNLGCVFCATASLNLKRNLTSGEIVDQYLQAQKHSSKPITNIVFMGMGEPLNNYDAVMRAVEIFNDQRTLMVAPRRTTLSTAGVVPGIVRMADEKRIIKLAVSLHATTQGVREKLMPIARRWPLDTLMDALEYYYQKTHKGVTFEYIVFEGVNDSSDDVKRLARFARRFPSKVNVIPFHSIDFTHPEGFGAQLKPSTPKHFQQFIDRLRAEDVHVLIRSSSGKDIDAACGQLALSDKAK
jgi:23S rRNA (adenine2503-C2)-methyltransferase